ncbi:MAG: sensor histidine kinase [Deltaproteobacteria bacterium]|nr:sensor histidine kinase [Deltaproteobacteria bacterium]
MVTIGLSGLTAAAPHPGNGALADLLIARTRTILWIALTAGLTFGTLELLLAPQLAAPFFVKCGGIFLTTTTLLALRARWVRRHALAVSLLVVAMAYLMTAISGIVSPSREYQTTAVLFVGAALTTATLLPWGVWLQAASVLYGAVLLGAAVWRADGNLQVLLDDPGAAVAVGFVISLVAARELQCYRLKSLRELAARQQAESEILALNADLERRVATRTEALQAANEQLHALSARLESVREEERTRLAREIHDELGQMLAALKIDLDLLPKRFAATAGAGAAEELLWQRLSAMSELAQTMIHSVRRIASELRPSLLDDLGLTAAIEWLAREFQARCGVACTFTSPQPEIAVDQVRSTALFRIVQEALTNAARHSSAQRIAIVLRVDGTDLVLEVHDDGRGVSEAESKSPQSLDLFGIRERALLLGGNVLVTGVAGRGTTLCARIPRAEAGPPPVPAPRQAAV